MATRDAAGTDVEDLLVHLGWVRQLAQQLVGDVGKAEDVAQETWLAALRKPPRRGSDVRAWLGTVVRNAARDLRRADGARAGTELNAAREVEQPLSDAELHQNVEAQRSLALSALALSEPHRRTLILRYWQGLTPARIAAQEGVPLSTVKTRLQRALRQLRGRLDREHDGDCREWLSCLAPLAKNTSPMSATGAGVLVVSSKTVAVTVTAVTLIAIAALWRWPGGAPDEVTGSGFSGPSAESTDPVRGLEPDATESALAAVEAEISSRVQSQLPEGRAHLFSVRDNLGEPVEGASIFLAGGARALLDGEGVLGITEADGTLSLPRSAMKDEVHFAAAKAGYLTVAFDVGADAARSDVVLDRGLAIHVKIESPDGEPLVDVPIVASQISIDSKHTELGVSPALLPGLDAASAVTSASSDESGGCRISGLAPGTYYLYPPPWLLVSDQEVPVVVTVPQQVASVIVGEEIYGYALRFEGEGIVTSYCTGTLRVERRNEPRRFINRARRDLRARQGEMVLRGGGVRRPDKDPEIEFVALLTDGSVTTLIRKPKRMDRLGDPEVVHLDTPELGKSRCARVRFIALAPTGVPVVDARRVTLILQPEVGWAPDGRNQLLFTSLTPGEWHHLPLGRHLVDAGPFYDELERGETLDVLSPGDMEFTMQLTAEFVESARCWFTFEADGTTLAPPIFSITLSPARSGGRDRTSIDRSDTHFVTPDQYRVRYEVPGFAPGERLIDVGGLPTDLNEFVLELKRD